MQGVSTEADMNGVEVSAAAVQAAGGWYVQLLPFASDEATAQLTANLEALASKSPTTMVREGIGAEGMLRLLIEGLDMQVRHGGVTAV